MSWRRHTSVLLGDRLSLASVAHKRGTLRVSFDGTPTRSQDYALAQTRVGVLGRVRVREELPTHNMPGMLVVFQPSGVIEVALVVRDQPDLAVLRELLEPYCAVETLEAIPEYHDRFAEMSIKQIIPRDYNGEIDQTPEVVVPPKALLVKSLAERIHEHKIFTEMLGSIQVYTFGSIERKVAPIPNSVAEFAQGYGQSLLREFDFRVVLGVLALGISVSALNIFTPAQLIVLALATLALCFKLDLFKRKSTESEAALAALINTQNQIFFHNNVMQEGNIMSQMHLSGKTTKPKPIEIYMKRLVGFSRPEVDALLAKKGRDPEILQKVVEALVIHCLKTDMRKSITPGLVCLRSGKGILRLQTREGEVVDLEPFWIKSKGSELTLVELLPDSKQIINAFFVKIAAGSSRISFSLYKSEGHLGTARTELEALIEHVVSNLNNDYLIGKLLKSPQVPINHLRNQRSVADDDEIPIQTEVEVLEPAMTGRPLENLSGTPKPADTLDLKLEEPQLTPTSPSKEPSDNKWGLSNRNISKEIFLTCQKKLAELVTEISLENNPWKLSEELKGLRVWTQEHPVFVVQRGELMLDHDLETAKALLCDAKKRLEYDELLKNIEILETLSEQVALIRAIMKGKFPVSDREFITCRVCLFLNRDNFVYFNYTPSFYTRPETSGAVRGELLLQAVTLTRIGPKQTRLTYLSKSDPKIKGVPQFLIRQGAKASAHFPLAFKAKLDAEAA